MIPLLLWILSPHFPLQGPNGERLAFSVGNGQTSITYQEKNKKNPFSIIANEAQGATIVLNGLKDKSSLGLTVSGGNPLAYLMDGNGKVRASMVLAQNTQTPVISVTDADGKVKGSLVGQ